MTSRLPLAWMTVGVSFLLLSLISRPSLRLVYNATDSAPRGFYSVSPPEQLQVGDYVIARLPEATAVFAATRGYLPRSVPVLKQIAATAGQRVCIRASDISIDGITVARTLNEDGKHRPLTTWAYCRRLMEGELFLLNPGHPASFDSRYFGPIDVSFVRGRAVPL